MWNFDQTLIHGDATTTNFIFPPGGGGVSIDWERSEFADPAADLGRLMAEVTHSVNQYGGDFAEGLAFANELASAYCDTLTARWDLDGLIHRAKFYQAASTLRIARNGWLSHHDRLALILQAFVLFSR
jgi:aminoglycoside phosphotransferase (APT) family kinase protein